MEEGTANHATGGRLAKTSERLMLGKWSGRVLYIPARLKKIANVVFAERDLRRWLVVVAKKDIAPMIAFRSAILLSVNTRKLR
jgi:hypothetical protein